MIDPHCGYTPDNCPWGDACADCQEEFEYRLRHDGPKYEGDTIDWYAVQYRENSLESWSTVPRRFRSREDAEQYIKEQQ